MKRKWLCRCRFLMGQWKKNGAMENMEISSCSYKVLQSCDTNEDGACSDGFAYAIYCQRDGYLPKNLLLIIQFTVHIFKFYSGWSDVEIWVSHLSMLLLWLTTKMLK